METIQANTVVVGGGPGGYAAAIRLGQLGIDTIIIEKEKVGGTCLNVGCIPSKALLHASGTYSSLKKDAPKMGIILNEPKLDWKTTIAWKDGIVKKLVSGVEMLIKKNKVKQFKGLGTLIDKNTIQVKGEKNIEIRFENLILATGSSIVNLPPFPIDNKKILDSTGLLSLQEIPKSMVILGGGIIGMEMGTVFSSVGCEVTVLEMADRVLAMYEKDASTIVEREFKKLGGKCITGARALSQKETKDGLVIEYEKDGKTLSIEVATMAVAVGRKPNYEGLNLEVLNLELIHNRIPVNAQLQTQHPHIYAIGDLIDGPMLAHKATAEGVLAAEIISGEKASRDDIQVIPDVVYTKPEIASVGISEEEAKSKGLEIKVGKLPIAALGRSATTNESLGYLKYIADASDDRILGATIVSFKASELISEAALAIEMGSTLDDVALTIHPHPSFGEAHMEAAAAANKKAIHILN